MLIISFIDRKWALAGMTTKTRCLSSLQRAANGHIAQRVSACFARGIDLCSRDTGLCSSHLPHAHSQLHFKGLAIYSFICIAMKAAYWAHGWYLCNFECVCEPKTSLAAHVAWHGTEPQGLEALERII